MEDGYAMDLFDLRPFQFLIKPLAYEKIEQTVNSYLEISGFSPLAFAYKKGPDTFTARIKDIVYLQKRRPENHYPLFRRRARRLLRFVKRVLPQPVKGA